MSMGLPMVANIQKSLGTGSIRKNSSHRRSTIESPA